MHCLQELKKTVSTLRGPGGCPWDQKQTHKSLRPFLIEECAELLEALDNEDWDHMQEELGDLLLQIFLHAEIAEQDKRFSIESIARQLNEKLIRRHPHVFGESPKLDTPEEVLDQWQLIKAQEKKPTSNDSLFKTQPPEIAALLKAQKICKRIRKKDLPLATVVNKDNIEQLNKTIDEDRAGQLLFEIVAVCEQKNIDPEAALRKYCLLAKSKISTYANSQQEVQPTHNP